MATDERILRLENAMAALAELTAVDHQHIARLDQAYVTLTRLAETHDANFDELRTAQTASEHKIAALADAQIRTDEALAKLAEAQTRLAEAQAHSDSRLDALIDIVRNRRSGEAKN